MEMFFVCIDNLTTTHIVYFVILLNCYLNTLSFGLVSLKKLPTHTKLSWIAGGETRNILSLAQRQVAWP